MEDFLLQEHLKIKEHVLENFPKEICGVLIGCKKKLTYIPCTNIAEDDDEFIIDHREFTKISLTKNIVAIVHSHNGPSIASDWDTTQCNLHKLPFVIYGTDGFNIVYPKTYKLKGRIYKFGELDCFEAVRDWFYLRGISSPPRDNNWQDNWYDNGENYIDEYFSNWKLTEVKDNSLKYGDILVFKVFAPVPDHIGVYEDNDNFFHHAHGRISCSENLWDFWGQYLVKVLRHDEAGNLRR